MSAGLQVFDKDGHIVVDITSRLTLMFGQVSGSLSYSKPITIRDERIREGATWVLPEFASDSYGTDANISSLLQGAAAPFEVLVSDGLVTIRQLVKATDYNGKEHEAPMVVYYGGM